jgi:hypothetical protein
VEERYIFSKLPGIFSSSKALYIGLLLFLSFVWWEYTYYIDLKIAWGGYSPIAWVYKTSHPANFVRDFSGGTEAFSKSAVSHIYRVAYIYLGVKPEILLPGIIAFEIALIATALYVLSRTILPNSPHIVTCFIIILYIASYVKDLDLARQGPYFEGKFDNIADALRILAIATILKGYPILSAVLLAGSFISHPTLAVVGGVFVLATVVVTPHEILRPRMIAGAILFLIVSIVWIFIMYEPANFSSGAIPIKDWFDLSRLNSFHWFPVDYGLFTTEHQERFIPLIAFLLLFAFYFGRMDPLRKIDLKMITGIFSMLFLVTIGIIISVFDFSPALVKLCVIRADELVIIIGLIYVVNGLYFEIVSTNVWRSIVATIILISPFFLHPGYPLLFSILMSSPAWLLVLRGRWDGRTFLIFMISVISILLILVYNIAGISGSWASPAYTGGIHFKLFLILLIPLFVAIFMSNWFNRYLIHLALVIIFIYSATYWVRGFSTPSTRYILQVQSYKQIQSWAKNNTAQNALFMVDPTIYYGWADYSQRSSFGNLRGWIYNWTLSMNFEIYQEGMRRLNEFSINLNDYLHEKPSLKGFHKLSEKVKEKYYSLDDNWRLDMARRYGIDYFVMDKNEMIEPSMLRTAYENEYFLVLEPKIKSGQKKTWRTFVAFDFEGIMDGKPESLGWFTYSRGRPVTWPWGLTNESHGGEHALYIKQQDKHDFWLYTGEGADINPPSKHFDNRWMVKRNGKYRIKAFLKGRGYTDLYIIWYDIEGKYNTQYIHRHLLSKEYEPLVKIFELPKEAKEFRITFLLRGNDEELKTLFVDDFKIEILDSMDVK